MSLNNGCCPFNCLTFLISIINQGWGQTANAFLCSVSSPSFSNFPSPSFQALYIVCQEPVVYLLCHLLDITLPRGVVPLWHIITCANKSPWYQENSFVLRWRRLLTAKKGNTTPHLHLKRNVKYFVFLFYLTALHSWKGSRIGSA